VKSHVYEYDKTKMSQLLLLFTLWTGDYVRITTICTDNLFLAVLLTNESVALNAFHRCWRSQYLNTSSIGSPKFSYIGMMSFLCTNQIEETQQSHYLTSWSFRTPTYSCKLMPDSLHVLVGAFDNFIYDVDIHDFQICLKFCRCVSGMRCTSWKFFSQYSFLWS